MNRKLPPLNALRAFEAAARHLSISKAADELNVTPAAVSHQVKALEDVLGVQLFLRLNRAMMLTDAGQLFLPGLRDGFDRLAEATERLGASDTSGALTVSTEHSFAAKWLVPRLGTFREAHPDIDVRLTPSLHLVDFAREDVDVAVRYGRGDWPGLRAERLLTLTVFPVCSPKLLEGPPPLRTPDDLRHHTLLHEDISGADWRPWLLAAGAEDVDPTRGPRFDPSLVLQAAVQGQGVALSYSALAAADLAAGRLVKPFDVSLPTDCAYYVVCPEAWAERPKIAAFRDWLLEEARQEEAATATSSS